MSLEDRRTRGDLIQMFKIVNGHEKFNLMNGLSLSKGLNLNLRSNLRQETSERN